jgi:kynurenine formamidase
MAAGSRIYGAIGAPELTAELRRLVRTGRVYDLSYPIRPATVFGPTTSASFSMRRDRRHEDFTVEGPFGEATDRLEMPSHIATHVEALCHVSEEIDGRETLFGDVPVSEADAGDAFRMLGIEACPPILARGVLLDLARHLGREVLPDSYGVGAEELAACADAEGVALKRGDVVLIRVGFDRYRDAEKERFRDRGAGPTPEACAWLAEGGAVAVGSETMAFEQLPSPHMGHVELIRRRGVTIFKQVNLEKLAADQVYEFLFVALPLRLEGATASPVRPIAVV